MKNGNWYESGSPNDLPQPYTSISGGPDRVQVNDEPDPKFRQRHIGFVARVDPPPEVEPLLWEGDQA